MPSTSRKVWGVHTQVRASPASLVISPLSATLTSSASPSTLSHWSKHRRSPLLVRLSYKATVWASLVVQWLRVRLPMKTTWVRPLVEEKISDAREQLSLHTTTTSLRAQSLCSATRSHRNEKPMHCSQRKVHAQPKIKLKRNKNNKVKF